MNERRAALLTELAQIAAAEATLAGRRATLLAQLAALEGGAANDGAEVSAVPAPRPLPSPPRRRGPRVVRVERLAELGAEVHLDEVGRAKAKRVLGARGILRADAQGDKK